MTTNRLDAPCIGAVAAGGCRAGPGEDWAAIRPPRSMAAERNFDMVFILKRLAPTRGRCFGSRHAVHGATRSVRGGRRRRRRLRKPFPLLAPVLPSRTR